MWITYDPWQIAQLSRLATLDPERLETILNTLWNSYPGLFEELIVLAVDQEQLSIAEAAERVGVSADVMEMRLHQFRRSLPITAVVVDSERKVARLAEGQIAVWEVIREYRKLGSVERLRSAFPSLSQKELVAALRYAQENPLEIESQIEQYERYLSLAREQYPYSR